MSSSNIFTIAPMSHTISMEAGDTYDGYITIANPVNAEEDFDYRVTVAPYAVTGEDYAADFSSKTARTQIVDWITIENPVGTLGPNESTKIHFVINIPETAPAGGQYAAIVIGSNSDAEVSGGVSVNNVFEMASIIYAEVTGDTIEDGAVLENSIPGFVTNMPIRVSTLLTNTGNAHEIARISLEVKNFFSATQIYPQPDESGIVDEVIMPETSRYVTRDITNVSPLGIYEVTQTVDYLGEINQLKQVVVACPIWFMALAIATITAVITSIIFRIKSSRRKRHIV